jgi:aminopeptidase
VYAFLHLTALRVESSTKYFPHNRLTDTPANLMTPTIFSQKVEEKFASLPNKADVKIFAHDKYARPPILATAHPGGALTCEFFFMFCRAWAEEQGMGCFLGVTRGSEEPPKFLEIHYNPLGDEGDYSYLPASPP